MSRFTNQQQVQTTLLTFLLLEENRPLENETLGLAAIGAIILFPFIAVPTWLYNLFNTRFAIKKERQAILNELHLYESGQICNSYSHVEIDNLKRRLRELG